MDLNKRLTFGAGKRFGEGKKGGRSMRIVPFFTSDGEVLAYRSTKQVGTPRLWLRRMGSAEPTAT